MTIPKRGCAVWLETMDERIIRFEFVRTTNVKKATDQAFAKWSQDPEVRDEKANVCGGLIDMTPIGVLRRAGVL